MRTNLIAAFLVLVAAGGIARASGAPACDDPPCSKREMQAYENRLGKHMLRAQQLRFEAMSRGEPKRQARFDREFKRTQRRWTDAKRALETAGN